MRFLIQDTKQFSFAKEMLWVGVITLITVIIWIIYGVYVAFSTPTIDEDVSALFKPLNPTLDQDTLNQLETRFIPPPNFTAGTNLLADPRSATASANYLIIP